LFALALILFGLAYYLTALLGRWLSIGPGHLVSFWLPAGLYVAALLASEPRRWAWLVGTAALADIAFHYVTGQPLAASFGLVAANAIEAVAGALMVRQFAPAAFRCNSPRAVVTLTLASGVVANAIGASIGAAVVAASDGTAYASAWLTWWLADLVGILAMGPLALSVMGRADAERLPAFSAARVTEAVALLGALGVIALMVFQSWHPVVAHAFWLFPVLMWAALRFGVIGASTSVCEIAVIAARLTGSGEGHLAEVAEPALRVLMLQGLLVTAALSSVLLAAVRAERHTAEAALKRARAALEGEVAERTEVLNARNAELRASEGRYRSLVELSPDAVFLHRRNRITFANPAFARVLDEASAEAIVGRSLFDIVHA
jgi:integral membrane sensor domain MASE1